MVAAPYDFYVAASSVPDIDRKIFDLLSREEFEEAVAAAEEALKDADASTELAVKTSLAEAQTQLGQHDEAHDAATKTLAAFKEKADERGQAFALNVLAKVTAAYSADDALQSANQALQCAQSTGDVALQALVLHTTALIHAEYQEDREKAKVAMKKGMRLFAAGSPEEALAAICYTEFLTDSPKEALTLARKTASSFRESGDTRKEAMSLLAGCTVGLASPNTMPEAMEMAEECMKLFQEVCDSKGEVSVKLEMAQAQVQSKNYGEASKFGEEALTQCRKTSDERHEADALNLLAGVRLELAVQEAQTEQQDPDCSSATEAVREALYIYKKMENRAGEASATHKLAQIRYYSGALDMATMAAEDAQQLFRTLGNRRGEAGAILLVAHVLAAEGAYENARRHGTKAKNLFEKVGDEAHAKEAEEFVRGAESSAKQTSREKAKATPAPSGLVRLVADVQEASHLLSYFAEMDDDQDVELGEYDLSAWGSITVN